MLLFIAVVSPTLAVGVGYCDAGICAWAASPLAWLVPLAIVMTLAAAQLTALRQHRRNTV